MKQGSPLRKKMAVENDSPILSTALEVILDSFVDHRQEGYYKFFDAGKLSTSISTLYTSWI